MNTLSETLLDLHRQGVEVDLRIDDTGHLRVGGAQDYYKPHDVKMVWTRRFEGQSNPDDLSVLYGLQLPDGQVGVLVDGYGPSSDPAVTTFILDVLPLDGSTET